MSETEISHPIPPENLPVTPVPPVVTGTPVAAVPPRRRNLWPLAGVIGFLILAGGEGYLYRLHQLIPNNQTAIAVLQAQVNSLQQYAMRAQPAPDSITVQADLAQKFANLDAQVTTLVAQSAADHATVATLVQNNADLGKLTTKMTLLSRLESARIKLDTGQSLGTIPNAPPALAKFADIAPPTQAALVLRFPAAARAANKASVEKITGDSRWAKMKAKLESLVTITDGTRVVVGAPAAGFVEQARVLLDAGDLNGAVAALDHLSPTTQAGLGNWLPQARDLLAARAALITMADQS